MASPRSGVGTASSAFVDASLYQPIAAERLPGSGISEIAANASLAFIEAQIIPFRGRLLYQSCSVRKVSQLGTLPDFKPVVNQRVRCAEEP
jgi:hypothetical protein